MFAGLKYQDFKRAQIDPCSTFVKPILAPILKAQFKKEINVRGIESKTNLEDDDVNSWYGPALQFVWEAASTAELGPVLQEILEGLYALV